MGVIVETGSGKIEGERRGGHERFLGIPFAAPPVGERRWRAPEPAPLWSRVRPALQFGPSAPQPPSALPGMAVGAQDEDCLYLNVFTPSADGALRPAKGAGGPPQPGPRVGGGRAVRPASLGAGRPAGVGRGSARGPPAVDRWGAPAAVAGGRPPGGPPGSIPAADHPRVPKAA